MIIREFKESDLMNLYGTLSDPQVMEYIEPIYTLDKTRDFLYSAALSNPQLIYAAEDDDGNYIGYVIYHEYDDDSVELGWLLNRNEWGKGYASELTILLIERAKQDGKDAVIECDPMQLVSKHIAEKFGFKYQGNIDGCDVYKDTFELVNEWEWGSSVEVKPIERIVISVKDYMNTITFSEEAKKIQKELYGL